MKGLVFTTLAFSIGSTAAGLRSGGLSDEELGRLLAANTNKQNEPKEGSLFSMADCPGKCMTINERTGDVELDHCNTPSSRKFWQVDYDCAGDTSFFKIRHGDFCIEDPEDCRLCDEEIGVVDCTDDRAAWFSYGNLHKTSPKAYFLYNARCWLDEGLISVIATPSLEAKTCPEDHSVGACQRLEWNLDRFSRDVLYYEWSFNPVKQECETSLFKSYF